MMQPVNFTIGGVPEHFNLPWHLAIDQGLFKKESIHLTWKEYTGGTGAMAKDLRSGALDIAVLLTEGIVADIAKGNPSRIISIYVNSPLIWGIHVPAASGYTQVEQLQGKRYAISRFGSGSHLMAFVDARQRGWQLTEDQLVVVGDLTGARDAFKSGKADVFMWERFMTQPLVDLGEFRRLGECPTPWPCFVIAARQEIIAEHQLSLQKLLQIIYRAASQFKTMSRAAAMISEKFGLTPTDAQLWMSLTEWARGNHIPAHTLTAVASTLHELELIEKPVDYTQLYENIF